MAGLVQRFNKSFQGYLKSNKATEQNVSTEKEPYPLFFADNESKFKKNDGALRTTRDVLADAKGFNGDIAGALAHYIKNLFFVVTLIPTVIRGIKNFVSKNSQGSTSSFYRDRNIEANLKEVCRIISKFQDSVSLNGTPILADTNLPLNMGLQPKNLVFNIGGDNIEEANLQQQTIRFQRIGQTTEINVYKDQYNRIAICNRGSMGKDKGHAELIFNPHDTDNFPIEGNTPVDRFRNFKTLMKIFANEINAKQVNGQRQNAILSLGHTVIEGNERNRILWTKHHQNSQVTKNYYADNTQEYLFNNEFSIGGRYEIYAERAEKKSKLGEGEYGKVYCRKNLQAPVISKNEKDWFSSLKMEPYNSIANLIYHDEELKKHMNIELNVSKGKFIYLT